jgi:hypothetical protein
MFNWFEPVLYLDLISKFPFPETTERLGYFVGFADYVKKCGEICSRCQSSK